MLLWRLAPPPMVRPCQAPPRRYVVHSLNRFTATPWQLGKAVTARQQGYTIANLMARYQFNPRVALTVNVNNLFDKTYLSSLDTTFYGGYFGDPRNVAASLKYQF